ncbi:hypothetical protein H9Q72_013070 [Fusarium xylarioides]|uniref:Uncharacterized protein n=1 Tax=Fusarium xylarioides TaxID=221167 RepID=A0A9P7LDX2_9HYPO|nr:hypothetical protein H9Q72_013070 [Fusarium xylarioides]KAG5802583.1 hypothetical protein H9Q71_012834 [Fusarium xylarioides]KAG5813428.1 hypothetical protein H9Q74_012699 [Fusarium xylarioides]
MTPRRRAVLLDSIIADTPGPRTTSTSQEPISSPPIGTSPNVVDINKRFLEYDQRVADLERMVQEKEQELADKDIHMSNLGYKQLFKNAQRQLEDMHHQYRESQMLVSKYEEKIKHLHKTVHIVSLYAFPGVW